ncbi:hypothetical protein EVA_11932 [gut metagenome]|uniref:Uncharacterized protein n=1 Tax=gut metagenome TaxID=749906 RepID=J9FY88_9ZZZZ
MFFRSFSPTGEGPVCSSETWTWLAFLNKKEESLFFTFMFQYKLL